MEKQLIFVIFSPPGNSIAGKDEPCAKPDSKSCGLGSATLKVKKNLISRLINQVTKRLLTYGSVVLSKAGINNQDGIVFPEVSLPMLIRQGGV